MTETQGITSPPPPTTTESNLDGCIKVVKDLGWKAELQREIHSQYARKRKHLMDMISATTIFSSIIVTFLSIADPSIFGLDEQNKEAFFVWIALFGLILVFVSISDKILNLDEKYASHHSSIKMLTDFIRECHEYRNKTIRGQTEEERSRSVEILRETYSRLNQALPIIDMSPQEFLILKKSLRIKIEASIKLDGTPPGDIENDLKELDKLTKRRIIKK